MEFWRRSILRKHRIDKPGVLLDVGCNIGQAMGDFFAVRRAGDHYVGIEPNPICARLAQARSRFYSWGLPIDIINVAAWKVQTSGSLYRRHWHPTDPLSTIQSELRPQRKFLGAREVKMVTIDSIKLVQNQSVCAAKIDVEGSELEALEGMATLIKRDRFPIIVEILGRDPGADIESYLERWVSLLDLLSSADYKLYRILRSGKQWEVCDSFIRNPIDEVWTRCRRESYDYLAVDGIIEGPD